MNSQQRTLLALALCGAIFVAWQYFFPPPTLEPDASDAPDAVEQQDEVAADVSSETSDEKTTDTDDDASQPSEPASPSTTTAPNVDVQTVDVRNDWLAVRVGNENLEDGLVRQVHLLSEQFEGHSTATNALQLEGAPTLGISFDDPKTEFTPPRGTAYELRDHDGSHAEFVYAGEDVESRVKLDVLGGYQGLLTVQVTNRSDRAQRHRLHVITRVGLEVENRYDIQRSLCRLSDDFDAYDKGDVDDKAAQVSGDVWWGGVDTKYFTNLVVPEAGAETCEVKLGDEGRVLENDLAGKAVVLEPGASVTHTFGLYLGAKEIDRLAAFSAVSMAEEGDLETAIDWGWLGFVTEWFGKLLLGLLRWLHTVTASWGWSIVLLTIVVKVLTLPLTLRQMASMKAMKRIQPELQEIQKKYADDREKQGRELQALYARSGVNPLAGCLPLLVQFPIWIALYAMLGAVVELVHVQFLWLPDLTQQDPYYILPVCMGVMMMLQNRMMPTQGGDEFQAQMMRWIMPVVITTFMLFMPAGLGVYMFVNLMLSAVQTLVQVGRNENTPAAAAT